MAKTITTKRFAAKGLADWLDKLLFNLEGRKKLKKGIKEHFL